MTSILATRVNQGTLAGTGINIIVIIFAVSTISYLRLCFEKHPGKSELQTVQLCLLQKQMNTKRKCHSHEMRILSKSNISPFNDGHSPRSSLPLSEKKEKHRITWAVGTENLKKKKKKLRCCKTPHIRIYNYLDLKETDYMVRALRAQESVFGGMESWGFGYQWKWVGFKI